MSDPAMGLEWKVAQPFIDQLCKVAMRTKQDIVNLALTCEDGDGGGVKARIVFAVGPVAVPAVDKAIHMIDAIRGEKQVGPDDLDDEESKP